MEVYNKKVEKETAFTNNLAKVEELNKEIVEAQSTSEDIIKEIEDEMGVFNALKGSVAKDPAKTKFYESIDLALHEYHELTGVLSQGSAFYSQLMQWLQNLGVFVSDYCESRKIEKDQIIEALSQGSQPVQGGLQAPQPGSAGAYYNPTSLPQSSMINYQNPQYK